VSTTRDQSRRTNVSAGLNRRSVLTLTLVPGALLWVLKSGVEEKRNAAFSGSRKKYGGCSTGVSAIAERSCGPA